MKTLHIKFTDFWPGFNPNANIFIDYLCEHYNVVLSKDPDYIIYSVFGNEYFKHDCIRIFYTAENIRPDFNLCDYAIGFDWLEFEDRYLRFPVYMLTYYTNDIYKAIIKHHISEQEVRDKVRFCNFIYSNPHAAVARADFFKLLNTYKKVDSGGRYLNNLGYCVDNKLEFQRNYKFSIAFENSSTSGYTTEKIIQAFAAKTVPIYWGNPHISREFNTSAFINCHDYASFDAAINRIIEIDSNLELYSQMLKTPIYKDIDPTTIPTITKLNDFLSNIFSQDLDKAVRRSKDIRSACYERLRHFVTQARVSI